MTEDVYRELQVHLNSLPVGYPATKSGVEIRLLKHMFTPEESKIATFLTFAVEDLDDVKLIHERLKEKVDISIEDLEKTLYMMAKKGCIMYINTGDKKTYGNAPLAIGMFEYQVNKLTKEYIKDFHKYFPHFALEMGKLQLLQQRIIPVEESIDLTHDIANYDELKNLIETSDGPFCLINCICRQAMGMIGKPCQVTSREETCMGIGNMASQYIEFGWGREISKEEAIKALRKNQEEGLVLQPGNAKKIDFLCSCCGCCCESLQAFNTLPNPADFVHTNYYAEVNPDECIGCGTCIDICPMNALSLEEEISSVNRKRCIGCGNCVAKCPSDALTLIKKEKHHIPHETYTDLFSELKEKKKVIVEKELKREQRKARRQSKT